MAEYVNGLVSVVIPTYHRCDLLSRAIASVLNQTYKNIECIVVNDNVPGDDYSQKLYTEIEQYKKNDRFVFIEQETHINGAEARNCGIRIARGEYVAFLDDDDWWKEDKIEKQVAFIQTQSDKCGAVSTLLEFYQNGKVVRRSKAYKDGSICKNILRRQVRVSTCSVMLKHLYLDETGYFDNRLRRHQEIQLLSYFTEKYELRLLPEYLTCVCFDDTKNNPDYNNLVKIKNDFFEAVSPITSNLGRWEEKRIKALHMFELSYVALKEKKYGKFIKHFLNVFIDPITFGIAIKRVIDRMFE